MRSCRTSSALVLLLRNSFTLRLLGPLLGTGPVELLLLELLPPQRLHLLTRRPIAATGLPCQLEHLSLPGLFCGLVRGLADRTVSCSGALIGYLELLVPGTI